MYRLRKSNSYLDITKEQIEKSSTRSKNSVSDFEESVYTVKSMRFRFSLVFRVVRLFHLLCNFDLVVASMYLCIILLS